MKPNKTCAIISDIKRMDALDPLTSRRPVSLLPFDAIYRVIDFNLSNVMDAGINSFFMIFNHGMTQPVIDHISNGKEWNLNSLPNRYFLHFYHEELNESSENEHYYDGVIRYIEKSDSEFTVFMGNKKLCNIDLSEVKKIHQNHPDDMTAVYKKMPKTSIAPDDILLSIGDNGSVIDTSNLKNKTKDVELENLYMNITIVKSAWLVAELKKRRSNPEVMKVEDILKESMKTKTTWTFEYTGFLSNIFDVKSYYDANMEMLDSSKFLSLLHSSKKIHMKNVNEVPTFYSEDSTASNSQIAAGCLIYGNITHSIISAGSLVEAGAEVKDSIIMAKSIIKKNAVVKYAILDKHVVIEEGVTVCGTPEKPIVIKKNTHVRENLM